MTTRTILSILGIEWPPARISQSVTVFLCYQNDFRAGEIALSGFDAAIDDARQLLVRCRALGSPVIHVARAGDGGSLFDRDEGGRFVVAPESEEAVVEAKTPNGFVGTDLMEWIRAFGMHDVIFAGCSSHGSLSSTVRYACEHGLRPTVVSGACAARDLPAPGGMTLPASIVHLGAMASLADRHARIVDHARDLLD